MKKKEQELLNYLSDFSKPIRSAEIANALNISVPLLKTMFITLTPFMVKILFFLPEMDMN